MERRRVWILGGVVVLAVALALPAVVAAGPDLTATVHFGTLDTGSPFPRGHDSSFNARENLVPRTAVISAGGNVTFEIDGFHQPAVYRAGTTTDDIAVPAFPPNLFINDLNGRVALGPLNASPPGTTTWTTPAGTFSTPGRYLILCNVTPHFAVAKMYGWVDVK